MRARMALKIAEIEVEIREISLRDKPAHMLQISPKGTVPVLLLPDGSVIDESLTIMIWAFNHARKEIDANSLEHSNASLLPNVYAAVRASPATTLIETNDTRFKKYLDCYKYPERNLQLNPEKSQLEYRQLGETFFAQLENLLQQNTYLFGEKPSFADYAIFPFVRQFAAVDNVWFDQCKYSKLRVWLYAWLESELFKSVMQKRAVYTPI